MLTRPRDREVVCHASAWDMSHEPGNDDVRIKMCIQPDRGRPVHGLSRARARLLLPELRQAAAPVPGRRARRLPRSHRRHGESLGDAGLSVEHRVWSAPLKPSEQAVINQQMKMALEKIAFLPFGAADRPVALESVLGRDHAGRTTTRRGGSCASSTRASCRRWSAPKQDFDPGAKYHIPGNTPYTRYFLSFILQFQFHKALCEAAGLQGSAARVLRVREQGSGQALSRRCSRWARASPGRTRWRSSPARARWMRSAIIEYFQPLIGLARRSRTQDRQCGWSPRRTEISAPGIACMPCSELASPHRSSRRARSCSPIVLAMILAAANTYLGLFAGLTIASAIPAAVVSMAVLRVLGGGGILENNIVQTGASAGARSPRASSSRSPRS